MKEEPSIFAVLIESMKEDDLASEANQLDALLRHVAWTTGSEFLGEFGLKMKTLKSAQWNRMSDKTRESFANVAVAILKVWPEIGL